MQAAPARYVSVSELYSTDEVELLLDEIRELEPTNCRGEDLQDFEIAGSGCEGAGAGAGRSSPAESWDSHAQYGRSAARARAGVALYWRPRRLLGARGAAALAAVACSGAAAACVWAGAGLRLGALPLAGRIQLLQAAALSAALLHAALLAAALLGLDAALPPPLAPRAAILLRAIVAVVAIALAAGATATILALNAPPYLPAPHHLRALLYSAAGLGFGGACASGALACIGGFGCCREGGTAGGLGGGGPARGAGGGAYRAVPAAPPARPSTSRDLPL